uniref:Secreted protein n=1 Tax=Brassica oleracea var. oleracea TaxID=109376 RepID=A0A0D3AVZ9_BRAOL
MYSTRAFTLDVALVCCFLTGEGGEGEATASSHTYVDGRETIEEEIVNEDGCSGK